MSITIRTRLARLERNAEISRTVAERQNSYR
jgi:hypothetical protein